MSQRTVLLIAFHFPPFRGSSGMQRTLRFAQHLPKFGWRPIVLTAAPRAYDSRADVLGNEIPQGLEVHRAFALDTARQLSLLGRYPGFLTVPDRWMTWRLHAVPMALRLIRERGVDAILSTFPIATAHSIGLAVARRSGLPWVAEFRDPMWQGDYPPEPRMNKAWKLLEGQIFSRTNRVVVTTPGAKREYEDRFPEFRRPRIIVIENGYDEESFQRADTLRHATAASSNDRDHRITLVHSGAIYKHERDPSKFFAAIASMKTKGLISARTRRIILRASGNEAAFRTDVACLGIQDIVHLEPTIGYTEALQEMLSADGLLILQGSSCNAQVPAKLYEYLRANKPIAALTDPFGDTATTLRHAGTGLVAPLDSADEIERVILRLLDAIRMEDWPRLSPDVVAKYSRASQAAHLGRLLDEVLGDTSHAIARQARAD